MLMNNKYYVQIQKAYEEEGEWYVQGVATGTAEDRDRQRMSRNVIETFAKAIPLPLTNSHPGGDIAGDIGEVVYAEVLDTPTYDLFIKGKLDKEHPFVPHFVKQVQKGKKFAFSIEGIHAKTKTVWSDRLQEFIDEFEEVVPTGISITTMPSYSPSFLEVVAKSVAKTENDLIPSNLSITKQEMEDTKTEPVETTVTETNTIVETEVEVVETQPEKEVETVETETVTAEVEEVNEVTKSVESILEMVTGLVTKIDAMEKSIGERFDTVTKSFEEVDQIKKSMATTQELVKSLPLAKRSLVAKQVDATKVEEPKNFKEALLRAPIVQ